MIMMSGEDGSASASPSGMHSGINLTNITQGNNNYNVGGFNNQNQQNILQPLISPPNQPSYKLNITNDAGNSSIGGNPFATQAMIGLNQIPSTTNSRGNNRSGAQMSS